MEKKVLVIGSGGREHAIVWKLSQSHLVKEILVAPGSIAIDTVPKAKSITLDVKDFKAIAKFCKDDNVKLVVVGPEDPLANGLADALTSENIKVFGPQKNAARIESDKDWAKAFMDRNEVPTAQWQSFTDAIKAKEFIKKVPFGVVVKASGLAAGKGVVVASSKEAAYKAVDEILTHKKYGTAGQTIVIEELLYGEEVSVLAFCDGKTVKTMLPSQDHKRIFDNDRGPNTGGMGAYCPCPLVSEEQLRYIEQKVLQKTVAGFRKENINFVGVLYAGLMLTKEGPKVLEFNCRFGDPETEVILPLLETDLFEIMTSCCDGTLNTQEIKWKTNVSAVGVVMASKGYPEGSSKGDHIEGVSDVDSTVFHCGATLKDGKLVTNGGRVLILVSLANQLVVAAAKATKDCETIKFEGKQYRKDIAHKGIAGTILKSGGLTYKKSGVDINAGNDLVQYIKPAANSTNRPGVMGSLGGFGGLFDTRAAGYKDPLLVSGTDGIGTKLKLAQEMGIHSTIGIDLVAMCVNDVLAHGAEPLFFLDYFACGALEVTVAKEVVEGVAEGCRRAGCSLIGGETAEMPDMYQAGEYDLAGFAVGAVERSNLLPNIDHIEVGDVILGLPSSGVHSNGFSLVRKVVKLSGLKYTNKAPFGCQNMTLGEELLTPTTIYVKSVIPSLKSSKVKAFAHITGGGLLENIPRVLPKDLTAELDAAVWDIPEVFPWLATVGSISEHEMLRTFNCGIGAILVINKDSINEVLEQLKGSDAKVIGKITPKGIDPVIVKNFAHSMAMSMRKYIPQLLTRYVQVKKKVGVLISGSGTNLQALIDSTLDQSQHLGAEIVLVVSNKPNVEGLKRAERVGIPTKVILHQNFGSRVDFDMAVDKELMSTGVEIVCLAGFMRILSAEFVNKWRGRLINVHPALLPSFKGVHAQRQALQAGVKIAGCTVHFVEPDVDAGAIITQEVVPVEINDTEESLTERIKTAEHKAYPKALKLLATEKVKLGSDGNILWATC